jgi:hypothetical protein
LDLLRPDTSTAAKLAKNFRNLIHPGRAARLAQTCDRATAYSAIGALEHVIRDLSYRLGPAAPGLVLNQLTCSIGEPRSGLPTVKFAAAKVTVPPPEEVPITNDLGMV